MISPRFALRLTLAISLVGAAFTTACNDRTLPLAPEGVSAPETSGRDLISSAGTAAAPIVAHAAILRRTYPLDTYEYECAVLTPRGSLALSLKKAGLKVIFSEGAVSAPTRVCVTANPGYLVTYSFYPHGLHFNNAIKVQQDLKITNAWKNNEIMKGMLGGYMANGVEHDVNGRGIGGFAQVFDVSFSDYSDGYTRTTPALAKFYTNHFSGYALASARSSEY